MENTGTSVGRFFEKDIIISSTFLFKKDEDSTVGGEFSFKNMQGVMAALIGVSKFLEQYEAHGADAKRHSYSKARSATDRLLFQCDDLHKGKLR